MRRIESIFTGELKKCFDEIHGCFFYKIPDSYGMERFAPKKPFDCVLWYRATISPLSNGSKALELKSMNKKTAFPFNKVKPHQIDGLLNAFTAGAGAYIIINYRDKETKYNKAFYLTVVQFITLQVKYEGVRKSIPFEEVEKLSQIHRVKVGRKTIWDGRRFLAES